MREESHKGLSCLTEKVVSWPPDGIGPVRLLLETSKSVRKERPPSDPGIKNSNFFQSPEAIWYGPGQQAMSQIQDLKVLHVTITQRDRTRNGII